ncbi:MAG: hypothetical protein HKP27_00395 [Myxococcales bacterium]|nr:hypothetical protein [Myxococcales bacterium]
MMTTAKTLLHLALGLTLVSAQAALADDFNKPRVKAEHLRKMHKASVTGESGVPEEQEPGKFYHKGDIVNCTGSLSIGSVVTGPEKTDVPDKIEVVIDGDVININRGFGRNGC